MNIIIQKFKDICFYLYIKIKFNPQIRGLPIIRVNPKGTFILGNSVIINSSFYSNPIGSVPKTIIIVRENATLKIGNNTGISNSCIYCTKFISIGNNVFIGGGVKIYDTDFHSIYYVDRNISHNLNAKSKSIIIEDNVFIGGHSIILKGVTIGQNSVIAAGSIVTHNVPPNEVWGGNPIKFLKKL
jgi:acetyltransferase-like isoleucine patch superfamily enzyme